MTTDTKIRILGATKASAPLTVGSLIHFAECVIRSDKAAALRAQTSVRISDLNELCGKSGFVKITSPNPDDDGAPEKLIDFGKLRRGS